MHWYAFPWTDYHDSRLSSRLQFKYAVKDALGVQDIVFDTKSAFGNCLDPWFSSHGDIYLHEEEGLPFRHRGNGISYMGNDSASIEFEIDPSEEEDYHQSRRLTYGDFRFPVIHDDWRHPPTVQQNINRNASQFYSQINPQSVPLVWDDE
jgi:hypothetical protein